MARRFRLVTWPVRLLCVVLGVAVGLAATGGLIGWRVTDSRMVVVALREIAPFWAVVAGFVAVVVTEANRPNNVVTKTTSIKEFRRILLAQLLPVALACVVGVVIGALPAIWTACQHRFPLSHWVALIAVLLGLVSIAAWAGLIATMIGGSIRWILVPIFTLVLVGLPEVLNATLLARLNDSLNADFSLLSVSYFWDIRFPSVGLDFQLPVEIFRALFFVVTFWVTIWAASSWHKAVSLIGRLRSLVPLVILLALVVISVGISPDLVRPSSERQQCSPASTSVRLCLYPVHESLRSSVNEVASETLADLPPLNDEWVITESDYSSSPSSGSIRLPKPTRDELKWRSVVKEQIINQVVPFEVCPAPQGVSTPEELNVQQFLYSLVRQRFLGAVEGVPEGYQGAAEHMAGMSSQEFSDWWAGHASQISGCQLALTDFR